MGRPKPLPFKNMANSCMRGGTAATPDLHGQLCKEAQQEVIHFWWWTNVCRGWQVLKTPIDKLPNEGLKKLAKSKKAVEAVARMGFKDGGIAKGGKCPSRGTIRGTGAAVRGVGFVGT